MKRHQFLPLTSNVCPEGGVADVHARILTLAKAAFGAKLLPRRVSGSAGTPATAVYGHIDDALDAFRRPLL